MSLELPAGRDDQDHEISVAAAFDALEGPLRITALLFYGEGFSLAEIAAATGVPVGTAKSRLFTARKKLRAILGDQ